LPARTEADEITAMMLAQVLDISIRHVEAVSVKSLASEIVDLVEQKNPMSFIFLPHLLRQPCMPDTFANVFKIDFQK
jgi:hypothetical protein